MIVADKRIRAPNSSFGVSAGCGLWGCGVLVLVPVVTLVSLSKTLYVNSCVLQMGRKAVGPVFCVLQLKETSVLMEKRRGSPQCFWFDWLHIVPQYLV